MRPGPHIRAVTFDLDDTLFDFQSRMNAGAEQVVEALVHSHPHASGRATVALFHQLWSAATAEAEAGGAAVDWPEVRKRGIERLVIECECHEERLVDELTALYFSHRHAPTPPFEDAAAAVRQLAGRLPLGIISNANSRLEQLGLADLFRVVLGPRSTPYRKPDVRIFHQAAADLGCLPAELLHVGDHWEHDAVGALRAGCQAALYRRSPGPRAASAVDVVEVEPEPGQPPWSYMVVEDHRSLVPWIFDRLA